MINRMRYFLFSTGKLKRKKESFEERIIKKAKKDLENGLIDKAINRYQGALAYNWTNQTLHNELGKLYLSIDDKILAGQHFYLKKDVTTLEKECIIAFEKRFNCPLLIARKILIKHNFKISELDMYSKRRFRDLIKATEEKYGITPKFLRNMKQHLNTIDLED